MVNDSDNPQNTGNPEPEPFSSIGSSGQYPHGPSSPKDGSEIIINIQADKYKKVVVLNFGETPVTWLGLPPKMALDIAEALIRHAKELR